MGQRKRAYDKMIAARQLEELIIKEMQTDRCQSCPHNKTRRVNYGHGDMGDESYCSLLNKSFYRHNYNRDTKTIAGCPIWDKNNSKKETVIEELELDNGLIITVEKDI